MNGPTYDHAQIKALAADPAKFMIFKCALDDALGFGLDTDDVRDIIRRVDEFTFIKTEPTRKYYPDTHSDYYIYFVTECLTRMFIKFLIHNGVLVVTSFKEDDCHVW